MVCTRLFFCLDLLTLFLCVSVIVEDSEITPTTATLLAELCHDLGLPAGVLNIVHGTGPSTGQPLIEHKNVAAISFTGGTYTGSLVASTAGRTFKKLSLELGGKNPNVIFAGRYMLQYCSVQRVYSFSLSPLSFLSCYCNI